MYGVWSHQIFPRQVNRMADLPRPTFTHLISPMPSSRALWCQRVLEKSGGRGTAYLRQSTLEQFLLQVLLRALMKHLNLSMLLVTHCLQSCCQHLSAPSTYCTSLQPAD